VTTHIAGEQIPRIITNVLCFVIGKMDLHPDVVQFLVPSRTSAGQQVYRVALQHSEALRAQFTDDHDENAIIMGMLISDATENSSKQSSNGTLMQGFRKKDSKVISLLLFNIAMASKKDAEAAENVSNKLKEVITSEGMMVRVVAGNADKGGELKINIILCSCEDEALKRVPLKGHMYWKIKGFSTHQGCLTVKFRLAIMYTCALQVAKNF
jgi:hypothetical protein